MVQVDTDSGSKLVSVIIPVYGAERYIADTLRSLLNQTYRHFEALIIDDGCRDRSIEICQQFTDSRIRIIHQENRGLAGARNCGIRHAQGDYIAFLDADDLWLPDKLAQHVQHLEQHPQVGVSFSYSQFIDEAGNPNGIYQIPSRITQITPAYALCRNPVGNGSAAVIRRAVLDEICFTDDRWGVPEKCYFDEAFQRAEDLECWTRIATHTAWETAGIPEALTLYRVSTGGLSASARLQYEAIERVIDKCCNSAPLVLGAYRNLARAYYMRYTARRAVTLRDADLAMEMMNLALLTDWRILIHEPRRTLMTIAAVYCLALIPPSLYQSLEQFALQATGKSQRGRLRDGGAANEAIEKTSSVLIS
ncbi:MAG: glycosyltransferase family 2 protein [Oculatellaceae cyanobacterium Prado106]|nr:glycosyltransferase family 2 protein [Oculatellaceae cyanobacterium Prado106]